jgi:hypothetical protein
MSAKPNLLYNPNCALLAILVGRIKKKILDAHIQFAWSNELPQF